MMIPNFLMSKGEFCKVATLHFIMKKDCLLAFCKKTALYLLHYLENTAKDYNEQQLYGFIPLI